MDKRLFAAAVVMAGLAGGSASAAVSTHTYAVTGSNFTSSGTPPFASITESVTITFDTALLAASSTSGIVLNASTITPGSTLAYTYIPGADSLIIGGTASTVATSDPASTDFALVISNASSATFGITSLSYSTGTGAIFSAQTVGLATTSASTVPEPASLAILGSTLAVAGFVRRRRR